MALGAQGGCHLRCPTSWFSKHTSKAASAWDVNAIRVSPARSLGFPYSLPTASLIFRRRISVCAHPGAALRRTCILTCCPSPLLPPTIAVTRTRVSLATKFRIHRSYLLLCPVCAERSNFKAKEKGRKNRRSLRNVEICAIEKA